jgi:hypothetical protein
MSQQTEIFANYELDNSRWTAIILKFLGGSILLHLVLLVAAIYVPAVRDAFYVAMLFSDTGGWTTKDYEKTEIEEAIVFDLPSDGRFRYPEGYFNTGEYTENPLDPTILAVNGDPTLSANPVTPPPLVFDPTPNPIATPTPFPSIAANPFPSVNTPPRRSRSGLPPLPKTKKGAKLPDLSEVNGTKPSEDVTAKTTPSATPKKEEVAKTSPSPSPQKPDGLNDKPLLDLADKAIQKLNSKELDLNKNVNVTVKGALGEDGKFVGTPTFINNGGDENLAKMATELVAAMSDSNLLTHVKTLCVGSKKCDVVFNISKDEKEIKFQLVSALVDEKKALEIQRGLSLLIGAAAIEASINGKKEEGELLSGVSVLTDKNQVVINWRMDTPTALRKIQNKLDKIAAEAKTKKQPSSQTANTNNAQATTK